MAAVSSIAPSESRFPHRRLTPWVYAAVLVLALVVSLGAKLRLRGAFACQAAYGSGYLSNCNASAFGDYDHGAMWFGLESDALRAASSAKVMFLGNSRLQFAFSNQPTREWFTRAGLSYYLLGFSHSETVMFMTPLLDKVEPRARVVVINVDRFFDDRVSPPAEQIMTEKDSGSQYRQKQFWQTLHAPFCGNLPALCGEQLAVYRDRRNGSWSAIGDRPALGTPISDGKPTEENQWPTYVRLAKKFVGDLGVDPQCVLLTLVPTVDTKREEAQVIAAALGRPLITPRVDGLTTFDGSHLDAPSAERWAAAFFTEAGPRIRACAADPAAERNDPSPAKGG